ncbi:hypothetical protein EJ08DRAFT_612725 [Tothia fuscella]|uniref:Uncharacterized protein n=1 Tax=Tothia fuscella TaxID=1048955 RepID=A0A9P4NRI0_9PEZI|nr:hypothetical protein EJ08DRAFT_612725 [Tothia fuscella]
MISFDECRKTFVNNTELIEKWGWTGPVKGILKNPNSQITFRGCQAVCGTENNWYPWKQSSATITTWLLPIVGIILQAPFESNAFWRTMLALARWVGSPMSSLSYILWNISVTGKCALMVDMAVSYDYRSSSKHTDFGNVRDSFYILTTINQYSIKPVASLKNEAEGLLRIVLFSKDLRLLGTSVTLREMRQELALALRKRRRRSVVPVYISTLWFIFALAISVQAAFGLIGENATAHDLALGLLLGWLPLLILCSIVDRNPTAADDVREQLNDLIDIVCQSLQDQEILNEFIESFATQSSASELKHRLVKISSQVQFLQRNFLTAFAGQGRVRWHYGAAHPILSDIENCYIADHGRDWLRDEEDARTKLVLGSIDRGLWWFDFRELWQISSAVTIVAGSCMGAFTISYFTPTVGLGCRSLGYLIFIVISFSLLVLEFLVWWLTEERDEMPARSGRKFTLRNTTFIQLEEASAGVLRRTASWAYRKREQCEELLIRFLPEIVAMSYFTKRAKKREKFRKRLEAKLRESHEFSVRQWTHRLFFIPMEIINSLWLMYIVLAQTFGVYVNCRCKSSNYGFGGGYVDLEQTNVTHNRYVKFYWSTGTTISCAIMGLGLVYIVTEWCLQAHLCTENYDSARKGLQRTRKFRRYTWFIRYPSNRLVIFINSLRDILFRTKSRQKTLVWTKNPTYIPTHEGTELVEYSPYNPPAPTFSPTSYPQGSDAVPLIVEPKTSYDGGSQNGFPGSAYSGSSIQTPGSVSGGESIQEIDVPPAASMETLGPRSTYARKESDAAERPLKTFFER